MDEQYNDNIRLCTRVQNEKEWKRRWAGMGGASGALLARYCKDVATELSYIGSQAVCLKIFFIVA